MKTESHPLLVGTIFSKSFFFFFCEATLINSVYGERAHIAGVLNIDLDAYLWIV